MMRKYTNRPAGFSFRIMMLQVLFVSLAIALFSCGKENNRTALAKRLEELEGDVENAKNVRELKNDIQAIDAQIEKTIDSVKDLGTYWRVLGLKYMDYQMWGKAIEAFDEAIMIEPHNVVLLYKKALCTGQMALSMTDPIIRSGYLDQAQSGYRRVLAIDPRYTPAMYALAVILVFETGEYGEAIDLMENFLNIDRSDTQARFLLARAYIEIGLAGEALYIYDDIARNSDNDEDRQKAEDMYLWISEGKYGT